jgi:hypothetical protein
MAKQTINIGASPNDGTGTPLRTAFDYTNQNFTELYTATGPSGNNIVVPGNATITGDLTVDTSTLKVDSTNNRVGIGTASPAYLLDIADASFATRFVATNTNNSAFGAGVYLKTLNGVSMVSNATLATSNDGTFNLITGTSADSTKLSIGPTGVFTFQNVGGVAGTAMTLNSSGLGIGGSPIGKFSVIDSTLTGTSQLREQVIRAASNNTNNSFNSLVGFTFSTSSTAYTAGSLVRTSGVYGINLDNTAFGRTMGLSFYTCAQDAAATEKMQIDYLGNVGIGVTPSAWGTGLKVLQVGARGYGSFFDFNNDVVAVTANLFWTGSTYSRISASSKYAVAYYQDIGSGAHQWLCSSAAGTNGVTPTMNTNMTLDASGNLLVGTTASGGQNGFCVLRPLSAAVVATTTETAHNFGALTGTTYATFLYATTAIGSITQNGTTGVLYNINSDYRLKESVAPLSGGLARVNALKPSIYKWKSDGSSGEGFLAHELAEVVPAAVTGEKDAVNEDGSIKSQGIDMSRVVPILVAAIQELTARVQTLEAK